MDKYFICLANSYKRGGRCVAGVEIVLDRNGGWEPVLNEDGRPRWIRPIAQTTYGEIPNSVAENIEMLSVVKLTHVVPCPEQAHAENVYYSQLKPCNNYKVQQASSTMNQLVDTKHQRIFHNKRNAVSAELLAGVNYSLMLIHPDKASAYRDEDSDNPKTRMKFTYHGTEYDFPITDPAFLDEFEREPERYDNIPDVYLALSLGLEFHGWHYKLVAGVIIPTDSTKSHDTESISYMDQQKQLHHNAYAKWTTEDDEQLCNLVEKGVSIQKLCSIFGRNEGAIRSRIKKLGLDNESMPQDTESDWFDEYEQELARLLDKKDEIEEQINAVRARILQGMKTHGLDKINSEQFTVSYTPAKTVMQFDSRTFRSQYEELYSRYCIPKPREASIVVKRKVKD